MERDNHRNTPRADELFERKKILAKEGVFVVTINGQKVPVRSDDREQLTWEAGGRTHHSSFWPDEPVGSSEKDPTFFRVSAKYGLDPYIPAAEWWRRNESRTNKKETSKPQPEDLNFLP